MADRASTLRIIGPISFVILAAILLMVSLAPIETVIRTAFPMTLFAICFAIMIREPKILPLGAVAGVFLLRDILFFQPIGLEAAIVVFLMSSVRNARRGLSETYVKEWGSFGLVVCALVLVRWALSFAFALPLQDFLPTVLSVAATIAIYPLATAFLSVQFGLRKPVEA